MQALKKNVRQSLIDFYDCVSSCDQRNSMIGDNFTELSQNSDESDEFLNQIRMNALSAEYIYSKKISNLNIISTLVVFLNVAVPILILNVLWFAKGSDYIKGLESVAAIFSAVLLLVSVCSLIFKVDQKKEIYTINRRANLKIADDAYELLLKKASVPDWFNRFVVEQDARDLEALDRVGEKDRREAYRFATKKLFPGDAGAVCAKCGISPYSSLKGVCELCGV